MKILHIISSLRIGGVEKFISELAPRLKHAGHEVDILVFDGTRSYLTDLLEREHINIHVIHGHSILLIPYIIWQLRNVISQYDIVHTHNTVGQFLVPIAKWLAKSDCLLVTTEHSRDNHWSHKWGMRKFYRMMYNAYERVVATTRKEAEKLNNDFDNSLRIEVIHNGIDLSPYSVTIPRHIKYGDDVVVTMIGGFSKQKDQDTLIQAIWFMPERYNLWLVGDGKRRKQLEELVDNYGIRERTLFWGERNDIDRILSQSDIIVMSSHWEGLSLACIESMASGRPVVASNVDGLREMVEDAGLLFEHYDSRELSQTISDLATEPDFYNYIAESCALRAKDYDIENTTSQYIDLYNSIYAGNDSRQSLT